MKEMHLCVANVGIAITNFISEPEVLKSIEAPLVFGNKFVFLLMCLSLNVPRCDL
jgi:hypothetical protein